MDQGAGTGEGDGNGDGNGEDEGDGINHMTDDEYASYVRARMWEKSHGYIEEERGRREDARRKRREIEKAEAEMGGRQGGWGREKGGERGDWDKGVEEALRRGEERRRGRAEEKRWRGVWEGYLRGWDGDGVTGIERGGGGRAGKKGKGLRERERIVWPVESGRWEDVRAGEVERFLKGVAGVAAAATAAAASGGDEGGGGATGGGRGGELGELLKRERVRWHPDKMQQRAGEGGIDAETLKLVTAVFQVVDRMWGEVRGTTGG